MENKDQAANSSAAGNAPVMDVQPPRAAQAVAEAPAPQPTTTVDETPETAPVENAPVAAAAPVVDQPASVSASSTEDTPDKAVAAPNPLAVTPANAGAAKHHKAPVGAIVAALLIAAVLAGATIYAYIKTQSNSNGGTNQSANNNAQTKDKPTAAEAAGEVDTLTAEADETLKAIDENKDFSSTDLSDTTLGL